MRAARLIKMVLLLQTRRAMTGAELAAELEVSERTVSRDVLALSEAGVPVYADRGRSGGYRLVGGYRTRLTGIARSEAEALFLSGVPSALRDMGLADAASAARLKVSAALLPELRDAHRSAAQRFHLDAPGWFQPSETPPLLPVLADAVWDDRRVRVRYRRRGAEAERELEPYGLVLKAGVWYLAARAVAGGAAGAAAGGTAGGTESSVEGGDRRVYRVDRIAQVEAGDERFVRDEEFDLPGFWEERSAAFARSILRDEVELRLTAAGMRRLRYVTDRKAAEEALANAEPVRAAPPGQEDQRQEEQQEEDGEGPAVVVLPVESLDVAYSQLLSLGAECEVLRPSSLRARFGETGRRMAELYGTAATSGTAGAMGAAGLPGAESHAESQR